MKKLFAILSTLLVPLLCLSFTACPKAPVTPVQDADAADITTVVVTFDDAAVPDAPAILDAEEDGYRRKDAGSSCQLACDNIAKFPCWENTFDGGATCLLVCSHVTSTRVFSASTVCLDCIAKAKSVIDIRACTTLKKCDTSWCTPK